MHTCALPLPVCVCVCRYLQQTDANLLGFGGDEDEDEEDSQEEEEGDSEEEGAAPEGKVRLPSPILRLLQGFRTGLMGLPPLRRACRAMAWCVCCSLGRCLLDALWHEDLWV